MFNSVRLSWGRHCSVSDYHLSPQACQSSEKLSRVGFLPSFCQQATVWNCPNIFITRFYHNGSVIRPVLSASYKICSLNHMIYFCCNLVAWELMLKIILIKTHLIQQSHQQVCSLIPCEEFYVHVRSKWMQPIKAKIQPWHCCISISLVLVVSLILPSETITTTSWFWQSKTSEFIALSTLYWSANDPQNKRLTLYFSTDGKWWCQSKWHKLALTLRLSST